jgi:lysophospholipase L1-like esterase
LELVLRLGYGAGGVGASERSYFNPYQPNASLGYVLRPSWSGVHETHEFRTPVRINDRGLRREENTPERKPAGTRRVLVLGDSLTFGIGVPNDELFTDQIERRLRAGGAPIDVLNAAVPGYSSDHHLVYLRGRAFDLEPDAILVVICGNDIDDLAWSRLAIDRDGLPTTTFSRRRMIDRRGRMRYVNESGRRLPSWLEEPPALASHSALFQWLRYRLARAWIGLSESSGLTGTPNRPDDAREIEEMDESAINEAMRTSEQFRRRYYAHLNTALENAAAARGVPLHFLHVGPEGSATSDDCAQRSACIDIARHLPQGVSSGLRYRDDGHFDPEGHQRIANLIEQHALAGFLTGASNAPTP